jgi:nickel/cobalt transporter (NicO) family protein
MRRTDIGLDRQMMKFFSDIQSWLYGGASAELKGLAAGFDMMKLLAAMAIAAVFGMLHALMPGHGKTVIVSYYLGRPAQLLSSVVTSGILVLTHVGSAVVLVLAGFIVMRRTIGGAGRAPAFEIASAVLIVGIGLWLLFRALRPHEDVHAATDGKVLAFVTGLVPCPLTTFIMVYAMAQGIIAAGLLVTAGMAVGMTVTIALFALAAVLLRERLMTFLARTDHVRRQVGRGLEAASAAVIIVFGAALLATR